MTQTPNTKERNMPSSYLTEIVSYGGLPATRGEMIRDLQRIAATHTDDKVEQRRYVDMYLMGHSRAENPYAEFSTVAEAQDAIFASLAAMQVAA